MSKELITMNALEIAQGFQFKDSRLAEATKKITTIYTDAVKYADAKNREIASILSTVKTEKSYVKDGFKSVAEYAEKIFGIKKQSAYALATAGDVYNDTKASEALKAFSPSKLAEVSKVDRKALEADIKDGKITTETTQKELRDYAAKASPTKEVKPEILDRYTARLVSPFIPDEIAESLEMPKILDDWDAWFTDYIQGKYAPSRAVEIVKLPKCAAFKTPTAEKKTVQRRLYITEGFSIAVEFYTAKPESKPTPPAKPKLSIDELRALLAEAEKAEAEKAKK